MIKLKVILLALLVISFISSSQSIIDSTLFKAYKHNSKIILDEFFMNWENSFVISDNDFINQNDTVKELYKLLNCFYDEFKENKGSISYSPISDNTKYFILKDVIGCTMVYSPEFKGWSPYTDTTEIIRNFFINDFRPFRKIGNTKFLYLNDKYYNTFFEFFKVSHAFTLFDEPYYKDMKIYNEKLSFLSGYIKIIHKGNFASPGINYKKLLSDPILDFIRINVNLDNCFIYYSVGCAFMEDEYIKINGKWIKIKETCLLVC